MFRTTSRRKRNTEFLSLRIIRHLYDKSIINPFSCFGSGVSIPFYLVSNLSGILSRISDITSQEKQKKQEEFDQKKESLKEGGRQEKLAQKNGLALVFNNLISYLICVVIYCDISSSVLSLVSWSSSQALSSLLSFDLFH
jgi:hypothetical protein